MRSKVGATLLAAGVLPACNLLVDLSGFADGSLPTVDAGQDVVEPVAPEKDEAECLTPTDAPQRGRTFYISPTGSDTSAGDTRDVPLLTFAVALGKLLPGDTLVLLDGEYGPASGPLRADCNVVANGTPFERILVRAENQRRAWVKSDGTRPAIAIRNCSNWTIDGLYATSADVASATTAGFDVASITYSNSVKLRNSVVARSNRCIAPSGDQTVNGIFVYQSSDILIEDNEVYDYHTVGIMSYSAGTVMRGNYTNPRNWTSRSAPACAVSYPPSGQVDLVAGGIFENAVAEGSNIGIRVGENTIVRGSISFNNAIGLFAQPSWTTLENGAQVFDTLVAYNDKGLVSEAWSFALDGLTFFGNSQQLISLANNGGSGKPPRNLFVTRSLFLKNGDFNFATVDEWSFDRVNSFGNLPKDFPVVEPIEDRAGNIQQSLSTDPQNGFCIAYVPNSSPMYAAAEGNPIGANLRTRYRDGKLTCERYWDATTGRLRCGALVPGLNDDEAGSTVETRACINVHRRMNINNGCPIP